MTGRESIAAVMFCATLAWAGASADAALRIVTYNVDADTDRNGDGSLNAADGTFSASNVAGVLRAIGEYALAGNRQAPDVVSLQELYSTPSTTLSAIVANLNLTYGAGTYAFDPTVGATSSNGAVGNGPNGLIFNTRTVAVAGVTQVGTPSGRGEARAPLRYQLTSLAEASNNTFYVYSSHAKAQGGADNMLRRAYEFDAIRADADRLGADAHVILSGDLNLTGGSAEDGYQDLLAAAGTTLSTSGNPDVPTPIVAGAARFYDPLTSTFATSSAGSLKYYTESDDRLTARFDFELLTANTLATSTSAGLRLVDKSYLAFGNNYYSAAGVLMSVNSVNGSIDNAANANTSVTGYTRATLATLIAATDHLPVVADYVVVVPEPTTLGVLVIGIATFGRRRRSVS